MSIIKKINQSTKPFVFFHTWTVSESLLKQAITEQKSMDLDVCVDNDKPYLGHSREYHEKSGEPYFKSLPIWDAVDKVAQSDIFAMLDCKHYDAWPVIEEVVKKIGSDRCIVGGYVSEFKFGYSRGDNEPDYLSEWSPIEKLKSIKMKYPSVTTTACVKWPPVDMLTNNRYRRLVEYIIAVSKDNNIDTICLGVPDDTITDQWLRHFKKENIMPHIVIDNADTSKLTELYIGETDHLERTTVSSTL